MALIGQKFNANLRVLGKVFSEESAWQESVLGVQEDATLDPGASPALGARYILTNTAALNANFGTITGVGDGDIVEYNGSAFEIAFDASANASGAQAYNEADNTFYTYNETSWANLDLSGKQDISEKNQANGYAGLDANGLLDPSQIPDFSITNVTVVADIAARDALTVGTGQGEINEGDLVIVTDASADAAIVSGSASYIHDGTQYRLLKSGDDVLSVNGATGAVTVNAINELTGDITAGPASGSASAAATISALAVTEGKIADDAVTSAKIATDAVGDDAFNYSSTGSRSAAANDPFTASLTRTFTHNWGTTDVMVEVLDSVTGETCFVDNISRSSNAVSISINQQPTNALRVLLREVKPDQTSLVVS